MIEYAYFQIGTSTKLLLIERIMDLQLLTRKTHFSIFNRFCLVFARGKILSAAPLKIVPSQAKVKNCATNHPHHLLGVDDERIFRYS